MMDGYFTKDQGMFYTTGKLSENMETTPEGYLLCRNVPIARTGTLFYGQGEVPVSPGPQGSIEIVRTDEDLFNPATLASLVGKAVTLGHPPEFVNPENWNKYAKGTVLNPRQGDGADNDLLLVDLLITDKEAISRVLSNELREISGGYNAEYKILGVGRGKQGEIIFNHVALVKHGRCGERCAVQDEKTEGMTMDDAKLLEAEKRGMETGLFAAFKALLAGKPTMDESGDKEKESKDNNEVAELKKEIAELKAALAKAKEGTADNEKEDENKDEDGKKKSETGDSATLDAAMVSELVSTANIINPGYKPAADALKSPLALKRDILAKAYTADEKKDGAARIIEDFIGQEPKFATMDEATATAVLVGAGGLMRSMNNARLVGGLLTSGRTSDSVTLDKRFDEAASNLWKI